MSDSRITWRFVRESKFPAMVAKARAVGLNTDGWRLGDEVTPILHAGVRRCDWSTAAGCADYMQAWIDAFDELAIQRGN